MPGAVMKQLLGFVMFWIGVGILTTLFYAGQRLVCAGAGGLFPDDCRV